MFEMVWGYKGNNFPTLETEVIVFHGLAGVRLGTQSFSLSFAREMMHNTSLLFHYQA